MSNKNEIVDLGNGIYQIKYYWLGVSNVYMFLLLGDEKALLIDTGYASTHAKKYVESVTNLPVIVVNTHAHFDHICGNGDYGEAYISEKDMPILAEHFDKLALQQLFEKYKKGNVAMKLFLSLPHIKRQIDESISIGKCNYKPLPEEGYFELGNRRVSFFEIPGHTPGSIALWDENTSSLFPGDMLCDGGVLLGFDYSTSVSQYRESVIKMKKFYVENKGKQILASHHQIPVRGDMFDKDITLCDKIISGEIIGKSADRGIYTCLAAEYDGTQIDYNEI